ncbi:MULTISPECIES: hypothetical protein [unclassified Francisella]|uniref:hypothetical protein n=1 Tax=unclassified Francisella TaxID=2610885 RepID=UPI002E34163B|nr:MULTISPECIES: hypothetical protein [unclassified Francisella]MED7818425.1 hypothetical protein [Francisella sp. 19S2-4]MED7829320.1 hypothetical protein [Francisella sp. 19S2-10]
MHVKFETRIDKQSLLEVLKVEMVIAFYISDKMGFDFNKYAQYYFALRYRISEMNIELDESIKSNITNYLYSHTFMSSVLYIQKEVEDNKLRDSLTHLDDIVEGIFFKQFEREFVNIYGFLNWYAKDYDRFPISDYKYEQINFTKYNLEKTCYSNFLSGNDTNYLTISRVSKTYFQRLSCIAVQNSFSKEYDYSIVWKFFGFSIQKFLEDGKKRKLKLPSYTKYKNLELSLSQIRDILLNRWHAFCCIENTRITISDSLRKKQSSELSSGELPLVYLMTRSSLENLFTFFDSIYNDPINAKFNYYENEICHISNLLGDINQTNKIEDRICTSNISTTQATLKALFGASSEMTNGQYKKLSMEIYKKFECFFDEFFDNKNLECDHNIIAKNVSNFWINKNHLFMLDLFLLSKISNLIFTNDLRKNISLSISWKKEKYYRNLILRFNELYIKWLSHASELELTKSKKSK